jgi:hypothetical protein
LWTSGMNKRQSSAATRNPIPKYMTDSIMTLRLQAPAYSLPACRAGKAKGTHDHVMRVPHRTTFTNG